MPLELHPTPTRRGVLQSLLGLALSAHARRSRGSTAEPGLRLATFSADVTIPIGHACMGGGIVPAKEVADPLLARGFVFSGAGKPLVVVAVDWCEIRNAAYDRWRSALAEAVGTDPVRVLVCSIHQHDAPVVDLDAERLLRSHGGVGSVCDPEFHEQAVQRVAESARAALGRARPVSHVGVGKARVDRVASNRRYVLPDGKPAFGRTSATRDEYARDQPEGTIDPWLRCLSFWDGDTPLCVLSVYAVHPMSRYGQGRVSADFVGDARRKRQEADPSVFQIYASGCSGNVTAGKYNDGDPGNRPVLAGRMADAAERAWKETVRHPVSSVGFRSVPLRLEPREGPGFSVADLTKTLATDPKPFARCLAAMGASWRARADRGQVIDLPVVEIGPAVLLLLPGESYVEFQLEAQALRPESFVVTLGYGECATGYVPTEKAVAEGDGNLRDWCWVAPGAERAMKAAMRQALIPTK